MTRVAAFVAVALGLAALWPTTADAQTDRTPAPVLRVVDGDTIRVELNGTDEPVRYIGMDTPERGDPFFTEATNVNRDLVEGRTVWLERDVSDRDRYSRLLRYIYVDASDPPLASVNAELVRRGYAVAATYPPDVAYADMFVRLQREARANCRGLWAATCQILLPFMLNPAR